MINENMLLKDLYNEMKKYSVENLLISSNNDEFFTGETSLISIKDLNLLKQPTWYYKDMVDGANSLIDNMNNGGNVFDIYDKENIKKKNVKLIYYKADIKTDEFIIVLSGGAYGACCNLAEGFPAAMKFKKNFNVFVLSYETASKESFINGLMPEPINDFMKAYNFISNNKDMFNIDPIKYYVCGFSAGGHLAASIGLKNIGYLKYGISKPKALILIYPLVDLRILSEGPVAEYMKKGLFGINYKDEDIINYSPILNIDKDYPMTFISIAKDDSTVGYNSVKEFSERLKELNVKVSFNSVDNGSHGYGIGSALKTKDWTELMVDFINEN